jgi:DNA-binding transcriptional MerR regulator
MDISIGELSRRTGIPVKTIRYYSEIGLVPETGRTSAGYRRYNEAAVARLELVRTLRDLGLNLAAIRSVGDRQISIEDVASAMPMPLNFNSASSHCVGQYFGPLPGVRTDTRRYIE